MSELLPKFNRLIPIIYVRDLDAEVEFYKNFGFEISYEGDEFPGFIALRCESFEFGVEAKSDFEPESAQASFVWQMETDSFSKVRAVCKAKGYKFSEPKCYWEEWDSWEMQVQTPNGYTLHFDKHGKD